MIMGLKHTFHATITQAFLCCITFTKAITPCAVFHSSFAARLCTAVFWLEHIQRAADACTILGCIATNKLIPIGTADNIVRFACIYTYIVSLEIAGCAR